MSPIRHLSPERWAEVTAVVERLFAEPPERRQALIEDLTRHDRELYDLASNILRRDHERVPVLDGGLEGVAPLAIDDVGHGDDAKADLSGRHVGHYRLVRLLGRGGMGVVYLAARDDGQYHLQAALKLLPLGMHTAEASARFLTERQVLAELNHPNIARLLDGGITEDGTPYFVMEYVAGVPLDRYCDERRLDIRARLDLFMQVCAAVQHAHQNLVVHRDLKPSNILVDESGCVKLLDFGIAKLLSTGVQGLAAQTRPGAFPMTPEFAAPEQRSGGAITTATDVFALGKILYEVLSGERPSHRGTPYGTTGGSSGLERDAPAPSVAVRHMEADRATVSAARRGTTQRQLERALAGDLDRIIQKALEPDPARRYATARDLEADLRRHLAGEPVAARPSSAAYRAARFARRHKLGVAASTVTLTGLVIGLTAAVWQARVASRERDSARQQQARAEQVAEFLVGIFRAPDPEVTFGDSLSVRDLLDRGRRSIENELDADLVLQAALMEVMAQTYQSLGVLDVAAELADSALIRRIRLMGPLHPDVSASLLTAGEVARVRGDVAAADSFFRRALIVQDALDRPDPARYARALRGVAGTVGQDSTEAYLRAALAKLPGSGDHQRTEAASVMNELGLWLHSQARYDEAEAVYLQALAIQRAILGDRHPRTMVTLNNMAWLRQAAGDYAGAAQAHAEVLDARRSILGPRHFSTAIALGSLAEALFRQGKYDSAVVLNRAVQSIRSELFPPGHSQALYGVHMLARSLSAMGRVAEADSLYRQAITAARGEGNRTLVAARMINDHGTAQEAWGHPGSAEAAFREAWGIYSERLGERHPFTAIVETNVAGALRRLGKLAESESAFRAALEVMLSTWPDGHPSVARTKVNLAEVLLDRGDVTAAGPFVREGLDALAASFAEDHWQVATARAAMGRWLLALGRHVEAEPILLAAHRVLDVQKEARREDWRTVGRLLVQLYAGRDDAKASEYRKMLDGSR